MAKILYTYVLPRFLALLAIITLTFTLMKVLPGDPFTDEQALPASIQKALRSHYGLEDAWLTQYGRYLKGIITWDLGPSFRYKDQTVNQIISEGFPVSAKLGLMAIAIALSVGLSLGMLSALYPDRWPDYTIFAFMALAISIPSFILGALLQYVFALKWGLFPVARWGTWSHTILPALALAALPSAYIARLVRANLREVFKTRLYSYSTCERTFGESRPFHTCVAQCDFACNYLSRPLKCKCFAGQFCRGKNLCHPGAWAKLY